ncbi:MAG: hypothetical protein JKX84_06845 [Flavobacteriales bacterium]|nr:hypothetical protein [Flavobacteriales bacterium]
MGTYAEIVEKVKKLSSNEKEELQFLLERLLVDARRTEIAANFQVSKEEENGAVYSTNIEDLKKKL